MDDIDKVKNGLEFVERAIANEFDSIKEFWSFIPAFMEKYRYEASKLSYHINLIDELGADENAHSRILAKLLQQKTPFEEFQILESLIRYVKKNSDSFGNIHIKSPDITQETERIDLWIRDDDYAIIIENKIHWANDQWEQLSRYIDKTKEQGYKEEQVYIIYLSPTYDKTPEDQTWGVYKDKFKARFISLSYKNDILRWLTEDVLPNVRIKDNFLSSALEQYIDHLEGMFDLRNTNKKMNMELQEFIKKELGLTGIPQEDINKLSEKQEEINKLNNQLQLLKNNAEKDIFKKWQDFLKVKYTDYQLVANEEGQNERAGLIIPIGGTTVRVSISFDSRLYCQIDMDHHTEKENLPKEIGENIKSLLPLKNNNNQIWKYLPRYAYDDVFKLLLEVIDILIKLK